MASSTMDLCTKAPQVQTTSATYHPRKTRVQGGNPVANPVKGFDPYARSSTRPSAVERTGLGHQDRKVFLVSRE